MINLRVRTEYSFRYAYGKLQDVIAKQGCATITDRGNTFGHVPFWNECKKQDKKPILGVEIAVCENPNLKVRETNLYVTLLAKNSEGLSEIYQLVSLSTKNKHNGENRIGFENLAQISNNIVIIIENAELQQYAPSAYYGVSSGTNYGDFKKSTLPFVALSDNLICSKDDTKLYQIILGMGIGYSPAQSRTEMSHILNEEEWRSEIMFFDENQKQEAIDQTYKIAEMVERFDFIKAELPQNKLDTSLRDLCIDGANKRNLQIFTKKHYMDRMDRELQVIKEKNFEDYFYLVYDLVNYAKQNMLVGPARGSSAGSLVCYLLGITEVDPIRHKLLFERFVDLNRSDYPDIDLDFQDDKRDILLDYLKSKYGNDCVAKLGVISKYKPKSILTEISKVLKLQQWQIKDLKESIVESDAGDDRNLLEATFRDTKIGQEYIEKYPSLIHAQYIEGHSRHYGQHAAAVVVSNKPLAEYCSLDHSVDGCQLDKHDAEKVNLLKIDCLSLRTLTVIQNCLDAIGKDRDWLLSLPLNDQKAFDVINEKKYHGIFQFEGGALISVAKQINIKEFNDMAAITSLARPGTLINGEANRYVRNKNTGSIRYQHDILEPILKETYGVIVYQEQVMQIVKQIGNFSWEDTSRIRKAIGKSMGGDYINKMRPLFIKGCLENNVDEESANAIWKNILDMGSYTFNKSHAVAYSMLSYWCMVLKAYFPLEFALATLKNSKDDDQSIQILRELVKDGFKYKTFDKDLSEVDWSIKDGILIGGFSNIKGVGEKKAQKFVDKRLSGKALTVIENRTLFNGETPYDSLFEFKDKFHLFYDNWNVFLKDKPVLLKDIQDGDEVRFLAKIVDMKRKDINDPYQLEKRGGERIEEGCQKFLDILFADDTDVLKCRIARESYYKLSKDLKIGDYYLVSGQCCKSFKFVFINVIKPITAKKIESKLGY